LFGIINTLAGVLPLFPGETRSHNMAFVFFYAYFPLKDYPLQATANLS